jgi:phosphate transport system substrate-binding protein
MRRTILAVPAILALGLVLNQIAWAQEKERYTITGASLMSSLVESYLKGFSPQAPNATFIVQGATTGKGFKHFINKEAALVMASREMRADEKEKAEQNGLKPAEKLLGKICVAVVVNKSVPINELTMEQLRRIFVGEIKNWKDLGGADTPIVVTTRAVPETGTGVVFQKEILNGAPYSEGHIVMQSYGTTAKVCGNRMAIGYMPVSSGYYKKLDEMGVKTLGIRTSDDLPALYPAEGAIKNTSYPVTIPFYFYWDKGNGNKTLPDFASYVEKQVG